MVIIRLFGSIQIWTGGRILRERDFGGRKPKQLLEILLLQEGGYLAKDQLADLIWGDHPPINFAGTIEHYVSVIRRRLNPGGRPPDSLLVTGHGGYRIDSDRAWIDITAFDRLVERPGMLADLGQVEEALALVGGDLLEDEPYADWAMKSRTYYSQRHLRLLIGGAEAALTEYKLGRAAELATAAIRADPFAEDAYRAAMTAEYASGNQQEALHLYERCRRVLAADVGLEPTRETSALHRAILAQMPRDELLRPPAGRATLLVPDPVPDGSTAPAHPAPVGRARTAVPLIGRVREIEYLVEACVQRGTHHERGAGLPIVAVEGEAGSGKTRLLDEAEARLDGLRVVRIRCAELEQTLPRALLGDLVRAVAVDTDAARAALDGTFGGAGGNLTEAVTGLLGAHTPFVAMVDDAQWADNDSLTLLACAARRGIGGAAALVLAYRAEDVALDHPLARFEPTTRITLRPLTPAEVAPFGGDRLHEQTGGLPLYVAGVLGAARDIGDDGTRNDGTGNGGIVVAEVLREAVLTRFRRLGEDLWRVAVIAAHVPQPCGPEETARLLGLDPITAAARLERLLELGVLVMEGRGFRFRFTVVRDVLMESVSPARRRMLNVRHRVDGSPADRRIGPPDMPPRRECRGRVADRRTEPATAPSRQQPLTAAARP
jgi:DNA-binding SARP family transcriptional activator